MSIVQVCATKANLPMILSMRCKHCSLIPILIIIVIIISANKQERGYKACAIKMFPHEFYGRISITNLLIHVLRRIRYHVLKSSGANLHSGKVVRPLTRLSLFPADPSNERSEPEINLPAIKLGRGLPGLRQRKNDQVGTWLKRTMRKLKHCRELTGTPSSISEVQWSGTPLAA